MPTRTVGYARHILTILTALIVVALPATSSVQSGPQNQDRLKQTKEAKVPKSQTGPLTRKDAGLLQANTGPEGIGAPHKPTLYQREIPFWTFAEGPFYGRAVVENDASPDVIHLVVGDVDTRSGGMRIPRELTAADTEMAPGEHRYYLVQFREAAFADDTEMTRSLRQVEDMGVRLEQYVPNNGYIVRADRASMQLLRGSSLIQFIEPFHPAYKINPAIGQGMHPDAARAASDLYIVIVDTFPGERQKVEQAFTALGGTLQSTQDQPTIYGEISGPRIFDLARVEGVLQINEYVEPVAYSEESQNIMLNGYTPYTVTRVPSYIQAGIDGSGRYKRDGFDADGDGTVSAVDNDLNGNGILTDNAAQIINVIDTSLSTDAGDFADNRGDDGVTGQTATSINFKTRHRKMVGYATASSTGAGGGGDLLSCDGAGEGGFTHGQTTSGTAAGAASGVPTSVATAGLFTQAPIDWDGNGVADSYGQSFFFTSGTNKLRVDGVAPGARVHFIDTAVIGQCPESSATFGLNVGPLNNMNLQFGHNAGARIHNMSFGSTTTGNTYTAGAQQVDSFLAGNTQSMVFVSAGNSGDDTGADPDNYGQPATLGDQAENKNGVTVGATLHNARLFRVGFSSNGPAGPAFRVKPDVVAPGADFGGVGLTADYTCRDNDSTNVHVVGGTNIDCLQTIGFSGTSYSSPNVAGAAAVFRDYFAQGYYPDKSGTNPTNGQDRINVLSGAAVKAGIIASADGAVGGILSPGVAFNGNEFAHRYNFKTGWGTPDLSNILPLTTDPNTPLGIIIHDGGDPAVPVNAKNALSMATTVPNSSCVKDTFKVVDANQVLRMAVAWIDPFNSATDVIQNKLVLHITNPGADGILGTTNNANGGDDVHYYGNIFGEDFNDDGTIDFNCDFDGSGSPNDQCDFDRDGTVDNGVVSRGMCRSCGDIDGDGTSNNIPNFGGVPATNVYGICDIDNLGTLTTGTTFGSCNQKPIGGTTTGLDVVPNNNTAQMIVLSPDPNGDGTGPGNNADNQLRTGTWGIEICHPTGLGSQAYALVMAGGVSVQSTVTLDTNPLKCNGDIGLTVTEVAEASDPCCTAGGCNVDTCIEPRTRIEVRNPKFLTDGLDNDGDGTVDETLDRDSNGDGTNDSGEDLVDLERGGFGIQLLQQGTGLGFNSSVRLPASSSAGLLYAYDDGILAVNDSYDLRGIYDDEAGAAKNMRLSTSITDCVAQIDLFPIGQPGQNVPFQLSGGCDDDRYLDEGEAFSYEIQLGNLDGQTLRDAEVTLRAKLPIELDGCDQDGDGTIDENDGSEAAADPCRDVCKVGSVRMGCNKDCDYPNLLIHTPVNTITDQGPGAVPVLIGEFQPNFLKNVAFAVEVEPGVTFPEQVDMVVGLTAVPAGRTVQSCVSFRHLLDADNQVLNYSTDYPVGATVDRDINGDEKISNPIVDPFNPFPNGGQRDNYDKLNETITFSDLTTNAFGGGNPGFSGPWDFDSDPSNHQGFRSGIYGQSTNQAVELTLWGEDQNFNNILDGPGLCASGPQAGQPCACPGGIFPCGGLCSGGAQCRVKEDIDSNSDGVLSENHNLLGGCGWASSNGTNRGIWHTGTIKATGAGTCAGTNDALAISCEYMDTEPGTLGANLWVEFLTTPIVNKVHKNQDGQLNADGKDNDGDGTVDETDEGFAYRVELTDWRWNMNSDLENFNAAFTFEPDMDAATLDPVDLTDGFLLDLYNQGLGPTQGSNVNLIDGFPMFVNNDFADATGAAGQANGVSPAVSGTIGTRTSNRSCVWDVGAGANGVPATNLGPDFRLREPEPADNDCDSDIVSYGADGAPGVRGVDDDGNGVIDDPGEACPCFVAPDGQDDDADGRTDEIEELQNFWTCSGGTNNGQHCSLNGLSWPGCPGGTCNRYGKPFGYGDDVCGDGKIDENIAAEFARNTTQLGEGGNRIAQNGNWNIGTDNGPFLRFQTIEDFYGVESGESFQFAVGAVTFEGSGVTSIATTYGLAVDDMTVEWTETHPVNQVTANKCSIQPGPPPAAPGAGGGSGTAGSAPQAPGPGTAPQCASAALGSDLIFEASTTVPAQVVDVNANTGPCSGAGTVNSSCTQGTLDCSKFGFGAIFSNDCDGDGLFEVTIQAFNLEEPEGELFRLEQDGAGSPVYVGPVSVSSSLNTKDDGVIFVQWRGIIFPSFTIRYIDKNDGVTGTSIGADGKPGIAFVDDDGDSLGDDAKPGVAGLDDDGTGQCSIDSGNKGAVCNNNGQCTQNGTCTLIDDAREGCRDRNGDGTINQTDAFGDDICAPTDTDGDGTTDKGVDEVDELCPDGVKTLFSDDSCGCALNPIEYTLISSYQDADINIAYYTLNDSAAGVPIPGDNDGIADDGESVRMDMTVRNLSLNSVEDVELRVSSRDDDIACVLDDFAFVGTIPSLGFKTTSVAQGGSGDNFQFVVGNPNRTSTLEDKSAIFNLSASGVLVDQGGIRTPFFGTTTPQTVTFDLDLDASVANVNALTATTTKTIIFNTGGAGCSGTRECYTTPAIFYQNWTASAFPNRPGLHCQYVDPGNPNVGSTAPPDCFLNQDLNPFPLNVDNDADTVRDAGNTDWHLHRAASRPGGRRGHSSSQSANNANEASMHMGFHSRNGTPGFEGAGGPITLNTTNGNDWDTYHLDSIFEIRYNTPFRLGLGRGDYDNDGTIEENSPTLSFWHQMHLVDDDLFGLAAPQSFDAGVVHLLVDRDDDGTPEPGAPSDVTKDGFWIKLNPYYGIPIQSPQPFGNCRYDPDDDGNTEKDIFPGETIFGPSSTCFPEIAWACVGDTQDAPFAGQFGQAVTGDECFTEGRNKVNTGGVDENGDGTVNGRDTGFPACQPSVTNGPPDCDGFGGWMEAKFDLNRFRGQPVFIRFLTSHGQFGLGTWVSAFAPVGNITFTGNRDDGWYIDDLTVSGLQDAGSTYHLRADQKTPVGNTCPTDNCPTNPVAQLDVGTFPIRTNGIDDDLDGTIDENDETKEGDTPGVDDNGDGTIDNVAEENRSDAPGRVVDLDASRSTVTECIGGQLQYEFLADAGADGTIDEVITGFSTSTFASDNPECSTLYTVNVRCSSDVTGASPCMASDQALVKVTSEQNCPTAPCSAATYNGVDVKPLAAMRSGANVNLSWTAQGAGAGNPRYDVVRGDLTTLKSSLGNFTTSLQACVAQTVSITTATDVNPAGSVFYLLRPKRDCGSIGTYNNEPITTQVGVRDAEVNASVNACTP